MNKKLLYFGIPIVLILSCLIYFKWISNSGEAWRYIPNSAFLVIESNSLQAKNSKSDSALAIQKDVPFINGATLLLSKLELKAKDSSSFMGFVRQKQIFYSVHADVSLGVNYISYIPYNPLRDKSFISHLFESSSKNKLRLFNHEFDGSKIWEVYKGNNLLFAFILEDNYLILGESSVLIEDVSRKTKQVIDRNLKQTILFSSETIAGRYTKLYSDSKNIANTASQLFLNKKEVLQQYLAILFNNQPLTLRTINSGKENLLFEESPKQFSKFQKELNQFEPDYINLASFIPNSTKSFVGISLKQNDKNFSGLNDWQDKRFQEELNSLTQSSALLQPLVDQAIELGICNIGEADNTNNGDLVILKLKENNVDVKKVLYDLYLQNTTNGLENINYLGQQILTCPIQLASILAGDLVKFSKTNYITENNGQILISNNLSTLKTCISEITGNNVWGNNSLRIETLKKCKPAQMTVIICPDKFSFETTSDLKSSWSKVAKVLISNVSDQKSIIYQYANWKDKIRSEFIIKKNITSNSKKYIGKIILVKSVDLKSKINAQPILISNTFSNYPEIVLQTANKNLQVINTKGELGPSFQMKNLLYTGFQSFSINGKEGKSFIGSVDNQIVIGKRTVNGLEITNSSTVENTNLSGLAVFQSNASTFKIGNNLKNYLIFDTKNLTIKIQFKYTAINHRLASNIAENINPIDKDYFLNENGTLFISDITENEVKTDKVETNALFKTGVFIEGNSKNQYLIKAVSKEGEIITFEKDGNILERKFLLRTSKESEYSLIPEQNNKDWLILRQLGSNYTVLDKFGKDLLQFQNLNPQNSSISYLEISPSLKVFIL